VVESPRDISQNGNSYSIAKSEPVVYRIVDLACEVADIIKNDPKRAKTLATFLVLLGTSIGIATFLYKAFS